MVLLVFTFSACDKDDAPLLNVIPDELVGTWVHIEAEGGEDRLIIEEVADKIGRFEWYWNVQLEEDAGFVTVLAVKANFVIKANRIVATVTLCGSQLIEFEDDQVLDEIVWYSPEDEEWEWFDFYEDIYIDFELKNDQLIIKEDGNDDGDYDDEDEQTIFIKQD